MPEGVGYGEDEIALPLYARLMEDMPGIGESLAFGVHRGSNTLLRGGFLEGQSRFRKSDKALRFGRSEKFRLFQQDGTISARNSRNFFGGGRGGILGRRAERTSTAINRSGDLKMGFARSSRAANVTARPRALFRLPTATSFTEGAVKGGIYNPFQGHLLLNNSEKFQKHALQKYGMSTDDGALLAGGTVSGVLAAGKLNAIEARSLAGSTRAAKKLDKSATVMRNLMRSNRGAEGLAMLDEVLASKSPGAYGRAMASVVGGQYGQRAAGYAQAARGFAVQGDSLLGFASISAAQGAEAAMARTGAALGQGIVGRGGLTYGAAQAQEVLERGFVKTLGFRGTAQFAQQGGGKLLVARYGPAALRSLSMLGTASLVYDLGKMAGEVVKSGINLAKDANKSLQGSINKPLFGMGYKDSEAAATSRSRGVMAIQNSHLNARSALGAEASMMAAHFG